MKRDDAIRLLRESLPRLAPKYGIRALYIFGSVARDDARVDSDVDIAVEFEASARPTLFTLGALRGEVSDLLKRPVDLGELHSIRSPIADRVRREMLRVA